MPEPIGHVVGVGKTRFGPTSRSLVQLAHEAILGALSDASLGAEELRAIEGAYLQERREVIEGNKGEMGGLFERRSTREQAFMERTLEQAEEYQRQLEELRVLDAEDYNILKIRLETDIQNLEQHLEAMRATYQLNTEKLEYNYRVLVERDQENQSTINQQKRKIARQQRACRFTSRTKAKY